MENINDKISEITKSSLLLAPSLINYLQKFSDDYSKKLVLVFCSFLEHKDFYKMSNDYTETKQDDCINSRSLWDFNTKCILLEVIYPAL